MIIVSARQLENGQFEFDTINDIHFKHIQATYSAVRPILSNSLSKEALAEFDAEFDCFDGVDFSELSADNFNLAYQTLMSNPNNDEWLTPILPDLKSLMEADSRFKH